MPAAVPGTHLLARLGAHPGLCRDCAHRELRDSGRSVFVLCARSRHDPRFRRYPTLPVLACDGFERRDAPPGAAT